MSIYFTSIRENLERSMVTKRKMFREIHHERRIRLVLCDYTDLGFGTVGRKSRFRAVKGRFLTIRIWSTNLHIFRAYKVFITRCVQIRGQKNETPILFSVEESISYLLS